MQDDTRYTTQPFPLDAYWVIASDDLTEFMATAIPEDGTPRVAFFEREGDAQRINAAVPVRGRTGKVIRLDRDRCLDTLDMLRGHGFSCAIALADGRLEVLTELSELPSAAEGEQ